MRLAARPDHVVRRLEAAPERVGLVARDVGGLPPLLLQLTHLARDDFGILERVERFHLRAELFLDGDVGPLLPLVGLAQLGDLGRQGVSTTAFSRVVTSS